MHFFLVVERKGDPVTTTSSLLAGFRVRSHRRVHGTWSAPRETPLETAGGARCGSDVSINKDTATASEGDYQNGRCSGRGEDSDPGQPAESCDVSRMRGEDDLEIILGLCMVALHRRTCGFPGSTHCTCRGQYREDEAPEYIGVLF